MNTGSSTGPVAASARPIAWKPVALLTLISLAVYIIGFRAASFAWVDAIGASVSHVLPGMVTGILVWLVLPHIASLDRFRAVIAHVAMAVAAALFWLAMMMAITAAARPAIVTEVLMAAGPSTIFLGLLLYTALAVIRAMLDSRRRLLEGEAALARAELSALRAKVEPHFLYNVLETVAGLVNKEPDAAVAAIARLGRMLRRVLDEPGSGDNAGLTSVREELSFVSDYLEIERLRMGQRLNLYLSVADDVGDLALPRFAVQALAENAVKHGLSGRTNGGTLSISAFREAEQLVVVVADDGAGASPDDIGKGGVGLALLRRRLETAFPGRSRLDIAATPGRGVSVRMSIPAEEAP